MKTPAECLIETAELIAARGDTHGDWRMNMTNTAALLSAYLQVEIAAHQVPIIMSLVKISRMSCGARNIDDYDDLIGYAALAAALARGGA